MIRNLPATKLFEEECKPGGKIKVSAEGDELKFRRK